MSAYQKTLYFLQGITKYHTHTILYLSQFYFNLQMQS